MQLKQTPALKFPDDEAYRCLRSGELDTFLRLMADRPSLDLQDADLRGVNLRRIDPAKVSLRGA